MPVNRSAPHSAAQPLTVYYDGSCPLCRAEIGLYRDLPALAPIRWQDIAGPGQRDPAPDLDRATAMGRFHVRLPDGELRSGAAAFVEIWARLPRWRWLARLARMPGVTPLLELGYRAFLKIRPRIQRRFRRREAVRPQPPSRDST